MRKSRCVAVTGLVSAVMTIVTTGSAFALTLPEASSATPSNSPASAAVVPCDGQWHQTGTIIGEWDSGWVASTPGVDYARSIQYKALGGVTAMMGKPPVGQGPCAFQKKNFVTATQYRYKICRDSTACEETDYQNYQGGPIRGWQFPGKAVGYDVNANQWRVYADV